MENCNKNYETIIEELKIEIEDKIQVYATNKSEFESALAQKEMKLVEKETRFLEIQKNCKVFI